MDEKGTLEKYGWEIYGAKEREYHKKAWYKKDKYQSNLVIGMRCTSLALLLRMVIRQLVVISSRLNIQNS